MIAFRSLVMVLLCLAFHEAALAQQQCQCTDPITGSLRTADSTIVLSSELQVGVCSRRKGREIFYDFTIHQCGEKLPWITVGDWMIAEVELQGETLVVQELILLPPSLLAELSYIPCQEFTLEIRDEVLEVIQTNQTLLRLEQPDQASALNMHKLLEYQLDEGDLSLEELGWMFHMAIFDLHGWRTRFKALPFDFELAEDLASYHGVLEAQLAGYVANRSKER